MSLQSWFVKKIISFHFSVSRFFLQNIEWYVEDKRSSNSGQVYICFRGYPGVNTEIQHNGKYNEDENQMPFVNLKLLGSFKCFIMTGHWSCNFWSSWKEKPSKMVEYLKYFLAAAP